MSELDTIPQANLVQSVRQLERWVNLLGSLDHDVVTPSAMTRPFRVEEATDVAELRSSLPPELRYWANQASGWMSRGLESPDNMLLHIVNADPAFRGPNFPASAAIASAPAELLAAMTAQTEPDHAARLLLGLKASWIVGGDNGLGALFDMISDAADHPYPPKDRVIEHANFVWNFSGREGQPLTAVCPYEPYSLRLAEQMLGVFMAADDDNVDLARSHVTVYAPSLFDAQLGELLAQRGLAD